MNSIAKRMTMTAVLALSSGAAVNVQTQEERQFRPWVWGVEAAAVHQFQTDFSDNEGDFSVSRFFIQPSLGYAWDRRTSVSVTLGVGDSYYDFSPNAEIDGNQPWGRIRDYRISVPIRFSPTERSDVIVIPSVRSFAEEGAELDAGRTEGVLAGAGWKFSERLTLGPGFGWYSELGGGSRAFPIVVIDWKITDQLTLVTGRGLAASQGPGLTLNYEVSDKWKLGLTGRYEKIRFAVDTRGAAPGGIGEDQSLPLLFTAEYTPWPRTKISALLGAEFGGSLKLEDERGRNLGRSDFDTAPVIGLSFSTSF
jgi:hypothetical protein